MSIRFDLRTPTYISALSSPPSVYHGYLQALVEKRLPFCEKLWYGDHSSHGGHEGHDHHAHHHHKRRHAKRHLHVVEKYLDWLSPQQMEFIKELDKNNDFDKVEEKLTEYYKALPEAKRNEVRDSFRVSETRIVRKFSIAL